MAPQYNLTRSNIVMETCMSPYNGHLNNPASLILCDTTMREGEQCPGVVFTLEEKKELVRRLDAVGIDQIQFYPGKTTLSKNIAREMAAMHVRAKIVINSLGFEDSWKENADYSLECGTGVFHTSFYATPYVNPDWDEDTPKKTAERIHELIAYVKTQTEVPIEVAFIDATRADEAVLSILIKTALDAGADRIHLPDTIGAASPEAMRYLVSRAVHMAAPYGSIAGVHCHNDFGVALANTFASLEAGARLADVAVNGIGDRAGNTALAEFVVGLRALYGVDTHIDMKAMTDLSHFVSRITGRPIPVNQPLVGDHVFADQDDFHIMSQQKAPLAFKGIHPEDIGGHSRIMFGKLTGPATIQLMAERYHRPIDPIYYSAIREALYKKAESVEKGVCLNDDCFWQIVDSVISGNQV